MATENDEIGISGELTPTSFSAKIKSRAASAIDRLWGSKAAKKAAPIEAETAEIKAVSEARVKFINAVADLGLERLKSDPDFAARAMENVIPTLIRRQENKDVVVEKALDDLRQTPPDERQATGPDKLDDAFINRFERYAEDATSDELRERWGRVLASEIRKPGTFSGKVLRLVDELDASTAALFERLCQFRLDRVIPIQLCGRLEFEQVTALVDAGLITDPGANGQASFAAEVTFPGGPVWFWPYGLNAVGMLKTGQIPENKGEILKLGKGGTVGIPVYVLTQAGEAISRILPDQSGKALDQIARNLASAYPDRKVFRFVGQQASADQIHWVAVESKV